MPKIRILPETLSNKIAAGEVVERPSSVVKELVENALDADSTRIMIEIKKGGRSLIRVSDNGVGMRRDDALLALERYATSKIYTDKDLFAINTLGFRGEALPSIAAVSKFSLVTRDETSTTGTEILVEGGTIKKVSEIGAPRGTMVTAAHLFFNMPARRKFLKTVDTEMGHIGDAITKIALGWPDVQFRWVHNEKPVKNWTATGDAADRVKDVLGGGIKDNLCKLDLSANDVSVAGWISSIRDTRRTSRGVYIYVNGRCVRDRIIQHALFEGYSGKLVKGQFPVAVLFIRVPYDQVDVNVHPAKHEVRFARQNIVHETIKRAVAEALRRSDQSGWTVLTFRQSRTSMEQLGVGEKPADFEIPEKERIDPPFRKNGIFESYRKPSSPMQDPILTEAAVQTVLWEKKRFRDLRVIGQFRDVYILCESIDGLILIDQHAAHERVLFEQLKNRFRDAKKASQKLLIPETIDLGYREAKILEKLIPKLNELGLEIAPFGGDTFAVKSVPVLLKERDVRPMVVEMVEKIAEIGFSSGLELAVDRCIEVMACHGAVRANQKLSDREIKALLDQLDACDQPSNCPHGRPTWISWSLKDLEKAFKRIV